MSEVDWDQTSPERQDIKWFKGTAGKTDRIYIPEEKPLYKARAHFYEYRFFECIAEEVAPNRYDGSTCPMCVEVDTHIGTDPEKWKRFAAQTRLGLNIIFYDSDQTGRVTGDLSMEVRLWPFKGKVLDTLRLIRQTNGPLSNYDLMITTDRGVYKEKTIVAANTVLANKDKSSAKKMKEIFENGKYKVEEALAPPTDRATMVNEIHLCARFNKKASDGQNGTAIASTHGHRSGGQQPLPTVPAPKNEVSSNGSSEPTEVQTIEDILA